MNNRQPRRRETLAANLFSASLFHFVQVRVLLAAKLHCFTLKTETTEAFHGAF
jgi:hypothetical protein